MSGNYLAKRPTTAVKSNYDDRKGLGYGRLEPEFHVPKMQHDEFPYVTPDQHEEIEDQIDDDDLDAFVKKTNLGYHVTDYMSDRKNNPFYFAAGNTKIGEGINIAKNSMVPIPDLYKGREVALGGSVSGHHHAGPEYPSRTSGDISYGTKHGYSLSPPPMATGIKELPAYEINDIPPTEDDVMLRLRQLINAIHGEQEKERLRKQD